MLSKYVKFNRKGVIPLHHISDSYFWGTICMIDTILFLGILSGSCFLLASILSGEFGWIIGFSLMFITVIGISIRQSYLAYVTLLQQS